MTSRQKAPACSELAIRCALAWFAVATGDFSQLIRAMTLEAVD
jgi:hypothetical protein